MRIYIYFHISTHVYIHIYSNIYLHISVCLNIFANKSSIMTTIISPLNYKGGVGKSTTAYNLGVALWILGRKVLLIDTDTQCNLTNLIGHNQTGNDATLFEWLTQDDQKMPVYEQYPDLYYVPASNKLSNIESFLMNKRNREKVLAKKLAPYLSPLSNGNYLFDYIIIDCAPKEGIVNDNVMSASDYILIPTECSGFSLQGMQNLLFSINDVKENLNEKLDILGFLLIKYDKQTRISKQVTEFFETNYPEKVFKTRIRKNIKFDESPLKHQGIFEYAPEANGSEDYISLAEEITGETRPTDWQQKALTAWNIKNNIKEEEKQ